MSNNQLIGNGNTKFIIYGDSHATHVMSYLKDVSLSKKKDFSFYNVTHSACISLPNLTNYYNPYNKKFHLRKSCINLYKNINQIIASEKNEPIVVFYNTWFKHIIKNDSAEYNEDLIFRDDLNYNEKVIKAILDDIIKLREINKVKKNGLLLEKTLAHITISLKKGYMQCFNSKRSL